MGPIAAIRDYPGLLSFPFTIFLIRSFILLLSLLLPLSLPLMPFLFSIRPILLHSIQPFPKHFLRPFLLLVIQHYFLFQFSFLLPSKQLSIHLYHSPYPHLLLNYLFLPSSSPSVHVSQDWKVLQKHYRYQSIFLPFLK